MSPSKRNRINIDKVRASSTGHRYHEAWAARVALELLDPKTTLTAIALEGFSAEDAPAMSDEATEVADLVRYRGSVNAVHALSVETVQFKYSIARATAPMRASDIEKTIRKYALADADLATQVGRERVEAVARYEIVTNRPFHESLISAVKAFKNNQPLTADADAQAKSIRAATGLDENALPGFLKRLTLTGSGGRLLDIRASVHRTLADWGAAGDLLAKPRLVHLCNLIREKAGLAGQRNNLIVRVDVLAALEIAHEDDLFPTPDAFPKVSCTISRPVGDELITKIKTDGRPILVNSPGGMGKTVLMQATAHRLETSSAVVLFDCFGAGRWRDPADGRHRPRRALVHIANSLAGRGLCDILLPSSNEDDLVRALRRRLGQAVQSVRNYDPEARVVLLLDGIDHAAIQAEETHCDSFARLLLQSLSVNAINGVSLVASCRTERLDLARGKADCDTLDVPAFSLTETAAVVRQRDPSVTFAEVAALHGRSGGNPRILDALLRGGRPYDSEGPSQEDGQHKDLLDCLLQRQINEARLEAVERGISETKVNALLAGLALLPPPVPVAELAAAQALSEAAIESFASDLSPLLDRTPHGLIFRDEPTETLIRRLFRNDQGCQAVVSRLDERQTLSSYAARALPMVLTALGRTDDLIDLAFSDRMPDHTSRVAQRMIRLSRLTAALVACASEKRTDDLVRLLLETSRIAGGNERSDWYLLQHPDLVAISDDADALRRLFEIRPEWPGARHASLAIAHAFRDDWGEARRNAKRTFGWLNWRTKVSKNQERTKYARLEDQDYFGPAYVELLAGNTMRAALWLDQWHDHYSYKLFSKLVDMLENHAAISTRVPRGEIVRKASRCRLNSRPLQTAVLNQANLAPEEERRIILRLAKSCRDSECVHEGWPHAAWKPTLRQSLLAGAIKAAGIGLESEARDILKAAGVEPPRLSDFEISWGETSDVERCVLSAAIRAALENRNPSLADLMPLEIVEAIPARKRAARPEVVEAAIQQLLKDPAAQVSGQRKGRKIRFDYRRRHEAEQILTYRIRPLLPFAAALAALIRKGDRDSALKVALDQMEKVAADTQNYPFRDGPRFISRIAFNTLFTTADALSAISSSNAKRFVEWLIRSPFKQTAIWIYVVQRLSRLAVTHEAALLLAHDTDALIRSDTDISAQIAAYGSLARAIWRASALEAQAYFRRGLDVADATGSEDYDKATGLIQFGAQYSDSPLPAERIHDFVRICEINVSDSDKFDWVGFGRALARIGGSGTLAILARFADRELVAMGWTLAPLLAHLVKFGHLSADVAAALIGLDEPTETWYWGIADFATIVLPLIRTDQKEKVLNFLLTEIDREYLDSPPQHTVEGLLAAASPHFKSEVPSLARLTRLVAQCHKRSVEPDSRNPESVLVMPGSTSDSPEITVPDIDTKDPAAIDALLLEEKRCRPEAERSAWILAKLRDRLRRLDDRIGFLRALCEAQVPSLEDKLLILGDHVPIWRKQSAAIDDEMPAIVRQLARRHALELARPNRDSAYAPRGLTELSARQGAEHLIPEIIATLRDRAIDVSGITWQRFACDIAAAASPSSIRAALERFLRLSADNLGDFGDGPRRTVLVTTGDETQIVAGLLWFCLGSPNVHVRWRAAHAIRRLVDLGRKEVLAALVERLDIRDAGPFQDQKLPFFFLHAKLWLLIALARIAADKPAEVLPFRPALESVAFNHDFPHVLMQHFSATALTQLEPLIGSGDHEFKTRLQQVNSSPFPPREESVRRSNFHASRWGGHVEPENPFHFAYDFGEHEIDPLASVFGCNYSEVADACATWIRKWSVDIKNMWECPRSPGRPHEDFDSWSGGRQPQRDTWGGHLAWHALMLTAGDLLQRRPVLSDPYIAPDVWHHWLSRKILSRADGLWLADGTDCFPSELRRSLTLPGTKKNLIKDSRQLGEFAGLRELALADVLVVDGAWTLADGVDLNICSAIVEPWAAEDVAFAVATAEPFHRWLPREGDLSHWRLRDADAGLLQPLTACEQHDCELDIGDPYAASSALHRPRPIAAVIDALGLVQYDPFARSWHNRAGAVVFRADAWGGIRGMERKTEEITGIRLQCRVDTLRELLSAWEKRLVILVKARKYLSADDARTPRLRRRRGLGSFQVSTLVAVLGPTQGVRLVSRVPRDVRLAVAALSSHERGDFSVRLSTIRASRLKGT